MRRIPIFLFLFVLVAWPVATQAGDLERALNRRWLGAWVVTTVETYSDCGPGYTANRLNGRLVSSRGRVRFRAGELAKLKKVDLKRSRLDLLMTLEIPKLLARQDGPFTLYDEVECRVEFEVALPRKLVKSKDVRGIETALSSIARRHVSEEEARSSRAWNRRSMKSYPPDYDRTLQRHAVWRAEQTNEAVQARIDMIFGETTQLTDRLSSDSDYLVGFAKGIEAGRAVRLDGCSRLMGVKLNPARSTERQASNKSPSQARSDHGYRDGRQLVLALELLRRLPDCFLPVPEMPDGGR
jgi:hypothetical protein